MAEAAEEVVEEILHDYGNVKIYYYDTMNEYTRLKHDGKKFTAFSWPCRRK